ncbi:potassium channel family protein [Psychroflexus halocasei]|uniref:Voltage-gated potassium channel n=1 Tax=Psychroflexus halocasei TaxID=908615 RepID=A0A1H3YQX8_9FLAO|nr:potassium channel family protein [Psychroflexus halocasei]SEA13969.1 voltage-gated potassium channel [Psychroflexus halocasei]
MLSVTKLIIALLSLFSIGLLSATFFLDPKSEVSRLIEYYDILLCIVFFVDFCVQLYNAKNRKKFFFSIGWLDLISSIPVIHEFRYVRIFRVFRVIRIVKSIRLLINFIRTHKVQSLYGFILFISITTVILTSTLVLYFEKDIGNIKTAEDAIWWSFVSVTTVGYGDHYPVTTIGRALSIVLISTGIALFGALISYITTKVESIKEKGQ